MDTDYIGKEIGFLRLSYINFRTFTVIKGMLGIMQRQLMKRMKVVGLMVAIAAVGCQPTIQAQPSSAQTPTAQTSPASKTSNSVVDAQTSETLTAQATADSAPFVSVAHTTEGAAQIVEVDGQRYLELDEAFRSDSGPDLFVVLHTQAVPESYDSEDYVNLGRLQSLEGTQRYAIPEDVDIESLKSAVIWCQQFNVTFGYATL